MAEARCSMHTEHSYTWAEVLFHSLIQAAYHRRIVTLRATYDYTPLTSHTQLQEATDHECTSTTLPNTIEWCETERNGWSTLD